MKRLFCLTLCLLLLLCGCANLAQTQTTGAPTEDTTPKGAAALAIETNSIHYYFMSGEGKLMPENSTYRSKWGDACLVVFPNGQNMLIDTGIASLYPDLKAWLEGLGVTKLDAVVLTHPHRYHVGGAEAGLFADFPIDILYHNNVRSEALMQTIQYDVMEQALKMGDELQFGEGEDLVTVKVMWPAADFVTTTTDYASQNNQSLVLRFDFGEHSSLFTGDIYKTHTGAIKEDPKGYHVPGEEGTEEQMAALYTEGELDVDFMKLSRHGDPNTSNSKALFDSTTPELVVATGFQPLEKGYITAYRNRGYEGEILFDRMHGFIHVYATADGTMEYETSREDYIPGFEKTWSEEENA